MVARLMRRKMGKRNELARRTLCCLSESPGLGSVVGQWALPEGEPGY